MSIETNEELSPDELAYIGELVLDYLDQRARARRGGEKEIPLETFLTLCSSDRAREIFTRMATERR